MSKIILTTVISLNPVKTKFLRSSHPIPPAPTTRILAVLTLVPSSDSNTGFDILERILSVSSRIISKTIVCKINFSEVTFLSESFVVTETGLRVGDLPVKKIFLVKLYHLLYSFVACKIFKSIRRAFFLVQICKHLSVYRLRRFYQFIRRQKVAKKVKIVLRSDILETRVYKIYNLRVLSSKSSF